MAGETLEFADVAAGHQFNIQHRPRLLINATA